MSFLAPAMLAALPLAALPLVIHLINQRRYQTLPWAAMPFLLSAERTSRGNLRLRQWLILALRTIAVAALLVAAARPLASRRLGVTLGQADAAMILLDRSPSMQQRVDGQSKLEAAIVRLATRLDPDAASRWLLIESGAEQVRDLPAPGALAGLPETTGLAAPADIGAMLLAAYDYIEQNKYGRTDLWIVSDLRENDWQPASGNWRAFRAAVQNAPWQVRVHLLADDRLPDDNLAIRVEEVRREAHDGQHELALTLAVHPESIVGEGNQAEQPSEQTSPREVALQFEVDGTRTTTAVGLVGDTAQRDDYRIPLATTQQQGWGRVSLPADDNLADNQFYFVYGTPPPRRTTIVAEAPDDVRALRLAAEIAPDGAAPTIAEVYAPEQAAVIPWESTALLAWQAPLPTGPTARQIEQYVARGGQVVFFPPAIPGDAELFGMTWGQWTKVNEPLAVRSWQAQSRLLAPADAGVPLPVGQVRVQRYCELLGSAAVVARLDDNGPLLMRVPADPGGVYFWTTTARREDSNLAEHGVTLYVALQRAIDQGLKPLSNARMVDAGAVEPDRGSWRPLAPSQAALSTEYQLSSGAYAAGSLLWAVNRPAEEDVAAALAREELAPLFGAVDFRLVDGTDAARGGLSEEAWRVFLIAMSLALLGEGVLSLPRRLRQERVA